MESSECTLEKKARRNGSFLQDPVTLRWEECKKVNGNWVRTGSFIAHAAEILPDRSFRAPSLSEILKAHTLVMCYPESVRHEEFEAGVRTYFMDVVPLEDKNAKVVSCPTDLIDFSPMFKEELIARKHLPKKAFEKQSLTEHVERNVPETTDDVMEDISAASEDENLIHPKNFLSRKLIKIGERVKVETLPTKKKKEKKTKKLRTAV